MAAQLTLPGLDLASNELALQEAWLSVPGARKSDFNKKIQVEGIRRCLVRITEAQMRRKRKGQQKE